jgi:hypothetical protein
VESRLDIMLTVPLDVPTITGVRQQAHGSSLALLDSYLMMTSMYVIGQRMLAVSCPSMPS